LRDNFCYSRPIQTFRTYHFTASIVSYEGSTYSDIQLFFPYRRYAWSSHRTGCDSEVGHSSQDSEDICAACGCHPRFLQSGPLYVRFNTLLLLQLKRIKGPDVSHKTEDIAIINSLPLEILCEIFHYVSFSDIEPLHSPCILPSARAGPLLLSRICSHWRQIAIGTPLLWAAIHIHQRPAPPLIELWIERSQNLPFSFFWDLSPRERSYYRKYDYQALVFSMLFSIIHRWTAIAFFDVDEGIVRSLIDSQLLPTLSLTEVLFTFTYHLPDPTTLVQTLFRSIPTQSLRRFRWRCRHSSFRAFPCSSNFWRQLTVIQIGPDITAHDAFALISCSLNAVEIYLVNIKGRGVHETSTPAYRITLPKLESLTIPLSDFDVTILLEPFTCPNTRILRFFSMSSNEQSLERFSAFLTRSACPIQEIALDDYSLGTAVLQYLSFAAFRSIPILIVNPGALTEEHYADVITLLRGLAVPSAIYLEERKWMPGTRFYWFGWSTRSSCWKRQFVPFN